MVSTLCHSSFANLEQSTRTHVDKLSILAAQQITQYFPFYTTVTMLHTQPAVSSLLFVFVVLRILCNNNIMQHPWQQQTVLDR